MAHPKPPVTPERARKALEERGVAQDAKRRVSKTRKEVPPPKRKMNTGRNHFLRVRVTAEEWNQARYMAAARGYPNLSEYVRAMLNDDMARLYQERNNNQ